MDEHSFEPQVKPTRDHLAVLKQRTADLPPGHKALIDETLQAASTMLDQLQVAEDELDRQGRELSDANRELAEARRLVLHYAERSRTFRAVTRALLSIESGPETARAVLSHLRQLLPFVRASVATIDLDAGQVSLYAALTDGETSSAEGWQGPLEWIEFVKDLRPGQIHTIGGPDALESSSPLIKTLQDEGVIACASVPLVAYGQMMGVLSLGLATPGIESPEQADILCEIADELALAILQARLSDQAKRHRTDLGRRVDRQTAELRASRAQLRTVLESAPIGIAVMDVECQLLQCNSALQEILGYTREELRDASFTAFTHPDDLTAELEAIEDLRAGKLEHFEVEQRLSRKDGRSIWARVNVSRMRGERQQHAFAVGIVRDITQQRKNQEALVRAEKLSISGRLAASLAHEINNPLQAVIGCLGLAETKLKRGEDITKYLEVAHVEMRRAARIVARLRDLNRRSRPEDRQPTNVNELLERVFTVVAKQCQDRRVQVDWKMITDLPPVRLVADRMEQVFLNLILNALEAMPEGGWLRASTARTLQPDGIRVSFSDTGVGIPADVLPILFEPFYTTRPDGLGLGLYVTRNIVQEHDGRIEVESTVGEGTIFTVWLPV